MPLDSAALDVYRATRRQRDADEAAEMAALCTRAWAAARRVADVLRTDFGANHVLVFGSLVEAAGAWFDRRSDLDLAAWGIPDERYFEAVARVQDASRDFAVDVIAMERCPDHLRHVIESTGVRL
jgi:uncharacterized protein